MQNLSKFELEYKKSNSEKKINGVSEETTPSYHSTDPVRSNYPRNGKDDTYPDNNGILDIL